MRGQLETVASAGGSQSRGIAERASSLPDVDPDDAVVLTVVPTEAEAEIVLGLLQSAGIDGTYRDTEAIDSPIEDFTAAGPREILVREEDLEAARELIASSEN
jgi:hypothetical protein